MKKAISTIMLLVIGINAFAQKDTLKVKEVGLVFSNLNSFGLCYKFGDENTVFRITALTSAGSSNKTSYSSSYEASDIDTVPSSTSNSFSAGLNFGFEKRKHINDKFYFYYGLILVNSYSESASNVTTPTSGENVYFVNNIAYGQAAIVNDHAQNNAWTINSGLGIVVGVAYKLGRSFSIEAELIPSVTYSYNETKVSNTNYNVVWTPKTNAPSTENVAPVYGVSDKTIKGISYSLLNNNAAITIAYRIRKAQKSHNPRKG